MTTALVLSGGGSLGAVQVGMLQALAERGVEPDVLIGTSAGAINAAYVAGHGMGADALDELASIWRGLRRQDVFPFDPIRHVSAIAGLRPSLCSNRNLRRLIAGHLSYENIEDAAVQLHVVTTDLLSGTEVVLSSGDAASAVLASASIPGVFPAVEREGLTLVDGGVANNAAVSQAVELGADVVYVLPAGFPCALERAPKTALGAAVQALTLLIEQRLILDVARFAPEVDVRVLPPLCPLAVAATDFTHASELIDRARDGAGRWLESGGTELPHPERFLSMHKHAGRSRHSATAEAAPPAGHG